MSSESTGGSAVVNARSTLWLKLSAARPVPLRAKQNLRPAGQPRDACCKWWGWAGRQHLCTGRLPSSSRKQSRARQARSTHREHSQGPADLSLMVKRKAEHSILSLTSLHQHFQDEGERHLIQQVRCLWSMQDVGDASHNTHIQVAPCWLFRNLNPRTQRGSRGFPPGSQQMLTSCVHQLSHGTGFRQLENKSRCSISGEQSNQRPWRETLPRTSLFFTIFKAAFFLVKNSF